MRSKSHLALLSVNLLVLALALTVLFRPPATATLTPGEQAALAGPLAEPADWMQTQRADADGHIDGDAYARALAQSRATAARTRAERPAYAAATWSHLGPTNIGGRVVELAVDPIALNTVYAATASGGVWKSTTAGETWTRAWPSDVTQSLGALAAGSDGVLYAGTGEANPGGGSIVYGGTGLYRSADGGASWQFVGLEGAGAFGRIAVDPEDPKRVFAAASGNLYSPGGERGLYRSTDGGSTWERVLEGDNNTTGAVDVAIDPADPDNILVAMWDHQRLPTHRRYAGPGSGVYRSTDGGQTWARATLPGNVAAPQVGRIGVAFAPSNPERAYAIVANQANGNGVGLWRSDDGGATWSKTSASASSLSQSSFGWWFGKVWVDPLSADRLWVAGQELTESVNGGNTFVSTTQTLVGVATGAFQAGPAVHADQHAMVWDPQVPHRVYLGNDGGVYRSDAAGAPESWVAAKSQGWTQHYSVDVSEQNPNRVVSGLQDNMCQRNYVGGDVGHPHSWTKYGLCGDGLQTLINPVDDKVVYGCAQYGANCSRTLDGGVAFTFLGGTTSDRRGWWAPMQFDPNNPDVMYFGGNRVNRSTNGGASWTAISGDLTTRPPQLDPNPGYRIYGTITTLAAAKSDPNVLYVGTDDGLLWRTSDLGETWLRIDADEDLPGTWITRVAIDPADADVAYVAYSGFRNGSQAAHVFRTTDGGQSWDDISADLPNAPVTEVIVVGGRLLVGTDTGVYLTDDRLADEEGLTWHRLGDLPAVAVLDLRYHAGTNTVTAATFGHGIQRVVLP